MRVLLGLILCAVLAMVPLDSALAKTKHKKHDAPPPQLIPMIPPVVATYDVYVGGLHFITADIEFQEQNGTYHARVVGHTRGFWFRLFPWNTELVAEGSIRGDRFVPQEFWTHDVWGKKAKTTKLHFKKDGDIVAEFDPPQNDDKHEPVTSDQRRGALDPVTGLLQLLANVAVADSCATTVPIFDGKLLFNITTNDAGTDAIDEGDYGVFKGQARNCDANFTLVAGEWKNKVKSRFWYKSETERGRDPFHIWLAKPDPTLPEIPVKLESNSVWGLVMVHLSKWRRAE